MPRYLTPSKLGLLALVELYLEGAVPTNAIIPVIDFVTSHLLDCSLPSKLSPGPSERWKKAESTIRLVLSVHHFEDVLGDFAAADRLPGRRLWDRFLEKLWGIDSLHAMLDFFDQLPNRLARTRAQLREMAERGEEPPSGVLLSRVSPFGVFVRRCHLEYSRLQFDQVAELWKTFVKYRQSTAGYWKRRNPQHSRLSFDSVLLDGEHEWGHQTGGIALAAYGNMLLTGEQDDTVPVSTDDIESLLEFQIEQVQKYGIRVPPSIRDQFQHLVQNSHVVPSLAHYLSFSDAWRAGEFRGSFDYLHRYFDYTMQNRDRLFYQYALLNLGIVQSDFGCHKEAVATMLEAITTAKENGDTMCLNFALNWFFQFAAAHPNLVKDLEDNGMLGNRKDSLAFLRAKAKETGMWILRISALLSEARLALASGGSISAAMGNMVRSSQVIVEKNVKTMIGPQLALGIALWDRLGMGVMSTMACEVFLRCHARSAVLDDQLRLTCRMAGLLAGQGRHGDALAKLDGIDPNSLRSARPHQYLRLYRALLELRRDLHHNNLDAADALLAQLLQNSTDDVEPDMVSIIDSLHIEALTRRRDLDAAFAKVDRLLTSLRVDGGADVSVRVRLMLTKAHLFDLAGRPERGFSLVMRAASAARRARLLPLLWQAAGALANVLNALGEFAAAERLLEAALPRCLETGVACTAGTLFCLLADARMGLAGEAATKKAGGEGRTAATAGGGDGDEQAKKQKKIMLVRVHKALDAAFKYFSIVEDVEKKCEVMAKKAALFRAEGDHLRAENCAETYVGLWEDEMARR